MNNMPESPYKLFLFSCTNQRPPGHPKGSCLARGGAETLRALRDQLELEGIEGVRIQNSGCLGPCELEPIVVAYGRESEPDGLWYKKVGAREAREVVTSHLKLGKPVEHLRYHWEPVSTEF